MNTLSHGEVTFLVWQLVMEGEPEVAMLIAFDHNQPIKEDMKDE